MAEKDWLMQRCAALLGGKPAMAQVVNIQPLREHGVGVIDPPHVIGGYFRVGNLDGHISLAVVGHQPGRVLLGPLLDPRLVSAEPEGFVLYGMEHVSGNTQPQERMVVVARPDPTPPEFPLW